MDASAFGAFAPLGWPVARAECGPLKHQTWISALSRVTQYLGTTQIERAISSLLLL